MMRLNTENIHQDGSKAQPYCLEQSVCVCERVSKLLF